MIFDALRNLLPSIQFKKRKKTHGGVLLLVKLQVLACNFTKKNTPPWVFFMFFKLYKWYEVEQRTTYNLSTSDSEAYSKLEDVI